jgi:hypothetical protein
MNMIICPNCKRELNDNTYDSHTIYHNCEEGICKLCGYEGHWTDFIKIIKNRL